MRVAHLADPHLGFRQYHRLTPAGINQREADVANAFRSAIDGIIAERVDAVLIAGDLFHTVRPTNAAIVFAFRQFQRLREALPQAPIVLIAGNHDTPRSSETGTILRLFEEAGVDIAVDEPRRFRYPHLDLSVLAVPHIALLSTERPVLEPEGPENRQVLLLHGEVAGVFPFDRSSVEYGGVILERNELHAEDWTYVALGHYHVRHQVDKRAWYAGALEYVTPNVWGELKDEDAQRVDGKSWLLVDIETGKVEARRVEVGRRLIDLPPVSAVGRTAEEVDRFIERAVGSIPKGYADQVVRLVITGIPRHVVRELDHTAIRAIKASALHFQLDFRRPDPALPSGLAAAGRRQTLPELVTAYLRQRPLPPEIERDRFVEDGVTLLTEEPE